MKIAIANICSAFSVLGCCGTKVKPGCHNFFAIVEKAIARHDFSAVPGKSVEGQGFIQCPEAMPYISAGVGKRSTNPQHYHVKMHRGKATMFLKRECAAPVEGCALVVYTKDAYCADPEVTEDEKDRVQYADYVIVAVLGFAGPRAPLTAGRFVSNLAGGNKNAAEWDGDEIRRQAKEIVQYWDEWCVVAD